MDMPSVFYAVRPMNTDRSDSVARPKEIIAAPSRVYGCINYVYRESLHITEETAKRGTTRAEEGNNALRFIERAAATGFARIRGTP